MYTRLTVMVLESVVGDAGLQCTAAVHYLMIISLRHDISVGLSHLVEFVSLVMDEFAQMLSCGGAAWTSRSGGLVSKVSRCVWFGGVGGLLCRGPACLARWCAYGKEGRERCHLGFRTDEMDGSDGNQM